MSTNKNGQILLYCHFNKIIKEHKCNLHHAAILMMTSQILKSTPFTKTQKSRYLENETLLFLQIKKSLIRHQALLYDKE